MGVGSLILIGVLGAGGVSGYVIGSTSTLEEQIIESSFINTTGVLKGEEDKFIYFTYKNNKKPWENWRVVVTTTTENPTGYNSISTSPLVEVDTFNVYLPKQMYDVKIKTDSSRTNSSGTTKCHVYFSEVTGTFPSDFASKPATNYLKTLTDLRNKLKSTCDPSQSTGYKIQTNFA